MKQEKIKNFREKNKDAMTLLTKLTEEEDKQLEELVETLKTAIAKKSGFEIDESLKDPLRVLSHKQNQHLSTELCNIINKYFEPAAKEYCLIVLYQKSVYNPSGNIAAANKLKRLGIDISDLKTYQDSVNNIYKIVDYVYKNYDMAPENLIKTISMLSREYWQELNLTERTSFIPKVQELGHEIEELE